MSTSYLQDHIETVHEFARTNIQLASNRMKQYYDTRSDQTQFSCGEAVWLYNPKRKKGISPKFSRPWECPYLVTEQINDLLYRIQWSPHAKENVIHRNRLWKYQGDNSTSWLEPTTTPSSEAHTNHSEGNQPAPQPGEGEMTPTPREKERNSIRCSSRRRNTHSKA
jgi:hypothetical protein